MENKTYKELQAKAKAQGIQIFGKSKKDLVNILNEDNKTVVEQEKEIEQPVQQTQVKEDKETSTIPQEYKHLNLVQLKNFTKDDVDINYTMNRGLKLKLPVHIQRKLDREGYSVLWPFDTEDGLNAALSRGASFIYNEANKPIRVSAQTATADGRGIYHIALKIKKEVLEEERRQHRDRQLKLGKYLDSDSRNIMDMQGESLKGANKHVKFINYKNEV